MYKAMATRRFDLKIRKSCSRGRELHIQGCLYWWILVVSFDRNAPSLPRGRGSDRPGPVWRSQPGSYPETLFRHWGELLDAWLDPTVDHGPLGTLVEEYLQARGVADPRPGSAVRRRSNKSRLGRTWLGPPFIK